jgi:hypothetical protein
VLIFQGCGRRTSGRRRVPKPPTRIRATEDVSRNASNSLQKGPQRTLHIDYASEFTANSRESTVWQVKRRMVLNLIMSGRGFGVKVTSV